MSAYRKKVGSTWYYDPTKNGFLPVEEPPPELGLADDPSAVVPYTIPVAQPYNVPVANVTPTYDGSGQSVHPSVIDFAQTVLGTWNGYRYWMAHTPYFSGIDDYENPAILVSQNGYYWRTPPGLTVDPLYPMPPTGFSSDTHLNYDPDTDEILVTHRTSLDNVTHTVYTSRSADGITWPGSPTVSLAPHPTGQLVSPALVRVGAGEWRLYGLDRTNRNLKFFTSTTSNGPWTGPFETAGASNSDGFWGWHLDVQYFAGVYYATVDRGPLYLGQPDGVVGATSLDGLSWERNGNFMTKAATGWDAAQIYRVCIQPHENGTHFRCWYSAQSNDVPERWGTGLTHVLRSEWPAPSALPAVGAGTDYASSVSTDSPGLWWRMTNNPLIDGSVETDNSGNGRVGAYVGSHVSASTLSNDNVLSSRLWLGACYTSYSAWMNVSTFTVEAVIKPRNIFGIWSIFSLYAASWGWSLRGNGSSLQFAHSDGTVISVFGVLAAGTKRHVAVTVSSGTATIYLNGAIIGSGAVSIGTADSAARLAAGGRWNGTQWAEYYNGDIAEVAFYPGVALSTARLLAHYQTI